VMAWAARRAVKIRAGHRWDRRRHICGTFLSVVHLAARLRESLGVGIGWRDCEQGRQIAVCMVPTHVTNTTG